MWKQRKQESNAPNNQKNTSMREAIALKRNEIQKLKDSVPTWKDEVKILKEQVATLTGLHQFYERKDAEDKMDTLTQRIIEVESGNVEKMFEKEIKPFLEAEKKRKERSHKSAQEKKIEGKALPSNRRKRSTSKSIHVQKNNQHIVNDASVLNDFNAFYNINGPSIMYMMVGDDCPNCGATMRRLPHEALLSCEECGVSSTYVDASSQSLGFSEEVEYSAFSYRRVNHFVEWLNSFQARESTQIPQVILDKIMKKLFERRVNDVQAITPTMIRAILKDLKLRKYYENTMLITCRITGRSPPRLTPSQEEKLKFMFLSIQPSFEKHCPKNRKNFLSYSYCLYKFCELLGLPYTQYFSLLKGKEKLHKMDEIFKLICGDLDWEFVPSI
tara:strand:- start:530 stop:1687 length:1158 start_codon:yes stop_codon:yes gene_type:complete